jgi:hypothetical protein
MEAANEDGTEVSAHALADFWIRSVRIAAGNEHLHKNSAFYTCLALYKRPFSIPECEAPVAADEENTAPESVWNNVFKLHEVVYRCGKPRKIVWLMAVVSDWIQSGKFDAKDITVNLLKVGPPERVGHRTPAVGLARFLAWALDGLQDLPPHEEQVSGYF